MIIATKLIISVLLMYGFSIWLQVFISNKGNKWLGLILPLVLFLYSLIMTFDIIANENITKWVFLKITLSNLFMGNIPTIIYLMIYFYCKEKTKRNRELQIMSIHDLD